MLCIHRIEILFLWEASTTHIPFYFRVVGQAVIHFLVAVVLSGGQDVPVVVEVENLLTGGQHAVVDVCGVNSLSVADAIDGFVVINVHLVAEEELCVAATGDLAVGDMVQDDGLGWGGELVEADGIVRAVVRVILGPVTVAVVTVLDVAEAIASNRESETDGHLLI